MSFKMEWNGDNLIEDLKKTAIKEGLRSVEQEVRRDVSALRCPAHGESPKVVSSSISGDRLTTKISACCDDMLDKAQKVAAREE